MKLPKPKVGSCLAETVEHLLLIESELSQIAEHITYSKTQIQRARDHAQRDGVESAASIVREVESQLKVAEGFVRDTLIKCSQL